MRFENTVTLDQDQDEAYAPDDDFDDVEPPYDAPRDDEPPPRILERPDHQISRRQISEATLKVLYRLHRSGYKGYLVGGGVRDLMLGRQPKDFDVGTDARPGDIRKLFRNARIIGRRFRLAHIIFQGEVVEVATFRRTPDPNDQRAPDELLITSDNTFGTPRQDAFRRDFTINALFYSIADFSVIDYVGGIDDLESRLVRVIGDPDVRFCEDPVRMMRACEFAGRLDFDIEEETQAGIERNRWELEKAAAPRLTEELLALLKSGSAGPSAQWMLELGLLEVLLPEALAMIEAAEIGIGRFDDVLTILDEVVESGREVSDAVLLAAVLLPEILVQRFKRETKRQSWLTPPEFQRLSREVLEPFFERYAVPNLKKARMSQAIEGFHRLCEGDFTSAQRQRVVRKSYFDDALFLFEILVRATGEGGEELEEWHEAAKRRKKRPQSHVERRPRRRRRGR